MKQPPQLKVIARAAGMVCVYIAQFGSICHADESPSRSANVQPAANTRNMIELSDLISEAGGVYRIPFCVETAPPDQKILDSTIDAKSFPKMTLPDFLILLRNDKIKISRERGVIIIRTPSAIAMADNPLDIKTPKFAFEGTYDDLTEQIIERFPWPGPAMEIPYPQHPVGGAYKVEVPPSTLRNLLTSISIQTGFSWYVDLGTPLAPGYYTSPGIYSLRRPLILPPRKMLVDFSPVRPTNGAP